MTLTAGILAASCSQTADWAPAGDHIRTKWAAEVGPGNARPEYPRPQMIRKEWQSLNGLWNYAIAPAAPQPAADTLSPANPQPAAQAQAQAQAQDLLSQMPQPEGQILVPFCVESALSGVGRTLTPDDALWYTTTFKVPRQWKDRVLLHFDAVDWDATVWLNGHELGRHTGGYDAFEFDVTPYLKKGRQQLTVRVQDATDNDFQPRGKQVSNPQGIWYTAVSGIWQSVWIEPVAASHITSCKALADISTGTFNLFVGTTAPAGAEVTATIDGKTATAPVIFGGIAQLPVKVDNPRLWSPDSPELYDIDLELSVNGRSSDKVRCYSAMRDFGIVTDSDGHRRLALNGEPVFQYGPLDQGWWPDGLYTAPTHEAMVSDIVRTKEYGFNMIRKHIKVEPATWYRACDELGMIVWQDMPSFADNRKNVWSQGIDVYDAGTDWPASPEAKANFRDELARIVAQHTCFPCIGVWVPFNEAWSQFDTRETVAYLHSLDPTRLINHASGGNWVSGGVGDILDSHHYPQPRMRIWDPDLVNVLGEYGGIGWPVEGHLWQENNWGYVEFDSTGKVTDEYVRFSEMLLPLVQEGCSAAVYTQTTDVEGEVNGLMTYDREILKLDVARVREANTKVINSLCRQ